MTSYGGIEEGRKQTILQGQSRRSEQKQVIFCQSGRSFRVKADDLWVKTDDLWVETDDLCVKADDPGRKRTIPRLKADNRIWIFKVRKPTILRDESRRSSP